MVLHTSRCGYLGPVSEQTEMCINCVINCGTCSLNFVVDVSKASGYNESQPRCPVVPPAVDRLGLLI